MLAPAQPDVAALEADGLFARFESSPSGLSSDEAHRRLRQSGPNELPAPQPAHPARLFLAQVTHTLALLLWAGSGLAFLAGLPQLGWAILAIIAINAVFSFWQEYRASRLVEALHRRLPAAVRVRRDGIEQRVPAPDLVPGDMLIVHRGDRVAADARLFRASDLRLDYSSLTGESEAVERTAPATQETALADATSCENRIIRAVKGRLLLPTALSDTPGTDPMDASFSPLRNGATRIALALAVSTTAALAIHFLPSAVAIVLISVAIAAGVWATTTAMATVRDRRTARLEAVPRFGTSSAPRNIYDLETGFCSEWYFLLRLEEEVARSKRTGHNFVLLIVEPRRRLGQGVRNRLLRCLEGSFRSADRVGRLGELRFAALLVGCELEGARAVSRRITASVGRANIQVRAAAYPHDGQDWRGLLTAAGGTSSDLYPTSEPIWTPGGLSAFDRDTHEREAA